jgi:hypothetical protein
VAIAVGEIWILPKVVFSLPMVCPLLSVLTNWLEDGCGLWYNAALAREKLRRRYYETGKDQIS